MTKVEQFTNYNVADKINKFLEENDVEYVDMKLTDDFVYLIYSDKYSEDNIIETDHVDYSSLIDFVNENCIVDRNVAVKNRVKLQDFKNRYSSWCFAHFRPEAKINHEVIKNVLYPRFRTKIVKNSTNYLSNLKWVDNYRKPYEKYPEYRKDDKNEIQDER